VNTAQPVTKTTRPKAIKLDAVLTSQTAQEMARATLESMAQPTDIGQYTGAEMVAERIARLSFASQLPGYVGWCWVVTVARAPRARHATVSEAELLPADGALLAPKWVPWADRIKPGDLGPGDVLPHVDHDFRLEPGYQDTSEDGDQLVVWELGMGRPRVLSPEGRDQAATRWYNGPGGPANQEAIKATARCATCGFAVVLGGVMRGLFAVCANRFASRDGAVVSLDHGCGAHSETDVARSSTRWPANAPLVDDGAVVPVNLDSASAETG